MVDSLNTKYKMKRLFNVFIIFGIILLGLSVDCHRLPARRKIDPVHASKDSSGTNAHAQDVPHKGIKSTNDNTTSAPRQSSQKVKGKSLHIVVVSNLGCCMGHLCLRFGKYTRISSN